ncbi:E3 ubiquitin-protein ligase TRIM35-like isoform X2 [Silurus meridionalis]|uniref:E3 ubiquitin-protein ligase TRIM35-like isoform X2 n=1 Tax=Silurus meridionalis TaxID=175797 RepID=UPI001EEB54E5|nr:E3 ubiquitin-protein ligase TRIM35-like isoform X2 [Silurus meridionalis]
MASSHGNLEENLICSICIDIFRDPVVLPCSHSFCRECLERNWTSKLVKECPNCRTTIKGTLVKNLALKGACDCVIMEKRRRTSAQNQGVFCDVHGLKHELFCTDDQKLVCLKCVTEEHKKHNFCTIEKAADEHKNKLQKPLQELESKLQSLNSKRSTFSTTATKLQGQQTEAQIKAEFVKISEFLRVEENARLSALRSEQNTKRQRIMEKIAEVNRSETSISERIKSIQDDMGRDESLFLHKFGEIEKRVEITVPDTKLVLDSGIDMAKHMGNLKYMVWEKMKPLCSYYPVILDPYTKTPNLEVSSDLTSVSCTGLALQNSPIKISSCYILGSGGFSSGVHTWQVEVGGCEMWALGVVTESTKKKKSLSDYLAIIYYINSKCSWNPVAPKIMKVCVFLDMTKRHVIFSDPDTNVTIKTCMYVSDEKLYPAFFHSAKSQ